MSDRIFVGTRKGLFEVARGTKGWEVAGTSFLGDPISAVLATRETLFAALDLGHFGTHLWRRRSGGEWEEVATPAFPEKPAEVEDDPHPWAVGRIWNLTQGGVEGRIWAGTMPGALFRSDDGGASWQFNDALWNFPARRDWFGVAGGEMPGISNVLVDPNDPATVTIGVSCGGVLTSIDAGDTWEQRGQGFHNEYMPPDQQGDPVAQDIHQLARCAAAPDVVWCQHHSGIYRSTDAGRNFCELTSPKPSAFGFAVVAHPTDPKTAWFVPAMKDEKRFPVDARLVVSRTRDGGETFQVLSRGLPGYHAYDLVYRHALAVDKSGDCLAFGSTSGGFWISEDGGDSWQTIDARLPPVASVRFGADGRT